MNQSVNQVDSWKTSLIPNSNSVANQMADCLYQDGYLNILEKMLCKSWSFLRYNNVLDEMKGKDVLKQEKYVLKQEKTF